MSVAATLCALSLTVASARAERLPVTIQGPITVVQATMPATRSSSDAQIRSAVGAWAQAWAAQDVERYLASYAPAFKPPDGRSRKAWEALRRARVSGPRSIQVAISGVEVTRHDDARAAVTFRQDYRSDRYQDSVLKTLELVRDGERWLIVEERVVSVLPEADATPAPAPKATPAPKAAEAAAPAAASTSAPAPAPKAARAISAGLGTLQVISALGQPLRTEIDIISLRSSEIESVRVRLASHEAYRQAGLQRSPALTGAKLAIELRDGKPIVAVTTRDSVKEPILQLLVELEWGSGRLIREYAILLDPPKFPPPVHTVMGPKPAAAPPAPVSPPVVSAPPGPAAPAPVAAAPGVEYQVVQGDTLAKIAREHMHAGVTLDQMLIALYRANIGAFIDDDINLLLAGYTLEIPDRETVAAVDAEEAREAVLAQMGRSAETRRVIAETAPTARAAAAPRAAPKPAPSPDQVKLSRAEKPKPSEVAARDDDRIARDRALAEAKSRISELEKIVADLRQLLEIRNQRLAELEKRLAEVQAAPAAKPAVEAPKPAVEAPKPAVEAPKPAVEAPKPAVEAPKPAVEAPKPAVEAPKPAPAPPKPAPKPRPAPSPPAAEPGWVERYIGDLGDPVMLGGLGAVALLLIGYGAYAWRRKKRQARSQLSEALLGTAVGGPSALDEAAAAEAESAATAAAAAAQTDEADPLEEADVYLAYGRDAQAEELLREAVQKGDRRPIAYIKLLQIYAKRHDTEQFESTALKLRGLVAGEGAEWDKAMALGRSIDPGNALYGQGEAAEVAPEVDMTEEPEVDFDLDSVMGAGEAKAAAPEPAAPEAAAPEAAADKAVDFRIDTTANGSARTEKSNIDMTLDFDLSGATSEEPVVAEPEAPAAEEEASPARGGIDFDLGGITTEMPVPTQATQAAPAPESAAPESAEAPALELSLESEGGETAPPAQEAAPTPETGLSLEMEGEQAATPEPEAAPKPPGAVDLSTISFDLNEVEPTGAAAGGGEVNSQEVATKLHLAKAYEEIGDHDGARELLNEVIAEGNAAQQAQAKEMLAGLG